MPLFQSESKCETGAHVRNHSYENDFDLHENKTACRTHFHMKGSSLWLVLTQKHQRSQKCLIISLGESLVGTLIQWKYFMSFLHMNRNWGTKATVQLDVQSYLSLQTPVCENFVHSPGLWQHSSKHQCKTDNNQVRADLGMEGKKKYFHDWHVTSYAAPETTSLCKEHVHACSAKYNHKTDKQSWVYKCQQS